MNRVDSEMEALRMAQEACVRQGLPWRDPAIKKGWRRWQILTPSGQRGGNAVVYVRRKDGLTKVRSYER
jgi:hypothetical protein